MPRTADLDQGFNRIEKKQKALTPNPWLDKEFNKMTAFRREPGFYVDDIPERLGLLHEDSSVSLSGKEFAKGSIVAGDLAINSVLEANIKARSITSDKVAQAAITASLIGEEFKILEILDALPAAGTAGRLVFLTTDGKIYRDNGTVWVELIMPADVYKHIGGTDESSIDTGQLVAGAVTADILAANAVIAVKIAANAVTAAKIAAGTITADEIFANTITIDEIAVGTIPDVSCRVYMANALSPASTVWTTVRYNTVNHDTHSGFNTGTYIYTVQVAGTYYIHANVRWGTPTVADKRISARIEQNSSIRAYSDAHTSNTAKCSVQVSHVITLAVDDEIHVECYHDMGDVKALDPGNYDTYMEIHLLHH